MVSSGIWHKAIAQEILKMSLKIALLLLHSFIQPKLVPVSQHIYFKTNVTGDDSGQLHKNNIKYLC